MISKARGEGNWGAKGSWGDEIVVDYMLPAGRRDEAGDYYAEQIGPVSAERGEPWLSLLAPDDMAALLGRHGFGPVRHVRQRDMIPAAAWDRTDSLRPADLSRIAHARLGNRLEESRTTAGVAARHLAPPSRLE